jgi:hypothetical protein
LAGRLTFAKKLDIFWQEETRTLLKKIVLAGKNSQRAVGNPEMEFGGKTDIYKKNKVRVPSICVQHNIIFMSTTLSWNWEENMTVAEKKIE